MLNNTFCSICYSKVDWFYVAKNNSIVTNLSRGVLGGVLTALFSGLPSFKGESNYCNLVISHPLGEGKDNAKVTFS